MDFALSNEMDALALTDHGNCNGVASQQIHAKKLSDRGIAFKAIPGVEAYFVESLADWAKALAVSKTNKALQKAMSEIRKDISDSVVESLEDVGNEHSSAEKDLDESETSGGTIVELESESKGGDGRARFSDPVKQRSHLVLLPKNNAGLKSLFQMVSESYIDGFYSYPRMDFDIIRRHAKGNVVASSACVVGTAVLETNHGLLPLMEVVKLVSAGKQIFVLSYSEQESRLVFRRVLMGQCTKRGAKVVSITTKSGKVLRVTPDHKVLTDKGWLRADELNQNQPVSIVTSET